MTTYRMLVTFRETNLRGWPAMLVPNTNSYLDEWALYRAADPADVPNCTWKVGLPAEATARRPQRSGIIRDAIDSARSRRS